MVEWVAQCLAVRFKSCWVLKLQYSICCDVNLQSWKIINMRKSLNSQLQSDHVGVTQYSHTSLYIMILCHCRYIRQGRELISLVFFKHILLGSSSKITVPGYIKSPSNKGPWTKKQNVHNNNKKDNHNDHINHNNHKQIESLMRQLLTAFANAIKAGPHYPVRSIFVKWSIVPPLLCSEQI
jgi:hypothetical protein